MIDNKKLNEKEIDFENKKKNLNKKYCQKISIKINNKKRKTVADYPRLVKEWNYEKNEGKPEDYTLGSHKRVIWKCELGHEWETRISTRTCDNANCPYCSGQKVYVGYNDLVTLYPELAKEWDYEKNEKGPEAYTKASRYKAFWKCSNGHLYQACVYSRTRDNNPSSCPFCKNQKVLEGYNDLATTDPWILDEWDYKKNKKQPSQFTKGSDKKVWWICKDCGYSWEAGIRPRVCAKTGCPQCQRRSLASYPEKVISYYLTQAGIKVKNNYRPIWMRNKEIDVYLPDYKIGIEYDGEKWHTDIERDSLKTKILQNNNVSLIRVREPKCPELKDETDFTIKIKLITNDYSYMDEVILEIFKYLNFKYKLSLNSKVNIDTKRDYFKIKEFNEILNQENHCEI